MRFLFARCIVTAFAIMESQDCEAKVSNLESASQNNLCALVDTLLPKKTSFASQRTQIKSDRKNEDLNEIHLRQKEGEDLISARKSRAEQVMRIREVEDKEFDHAQSCLADEGAVSYSRSVAEKSNVNFSLFSAWLSLNHNCSCFSS